MTPYLHIKISSEFIVHFEESYTIEKIDDIKLPFKYTTFLVKDHKGVWNRQIIPRIFIFENLTNMRIIKIIPDINQFISDNFEYLL